MLKKILIANRGEIACRIIRACKEMGILTVAVYSEEDRDALHMQLADEAICIGPATATESYLNMQNILSAALLTNAEAIHPGFGFLSENSRFTEMCEELNIVFIGPDKRVIDQMGNKAKARELMKQANVPIIPGSDGFLTDIEDAKEKAAAIGFPVLLKAASGGGGKGMREIYALEDVRTAFLAAQAEAQAAFGDGRMYLEKIIAPARHIEVQLLADHYGNVIHLGERDCSLQRNHQKVMEESPSPALTQELREEIGKTAVRAASFIKYRNAGTVEFLLDEHNDFYFMEMNTRIQVEHPITEMTTGIDLIKAQIEIAYGLPLQLEQADVTLSGHAMECRINAENPSFNFIPSPGTIDFLLLPSGGPGIRVDSGLYQGCTISSYYDAMVAKVIVHGRDRDEAIEKMKRALGEMVISGIHTNQFFHQALLEDPAIQQGTYTTLYLENEFIPRWKETGDHSFKKQGFRP